MNLIKNVGIRTTYSKTTGKPDSRQYALFECEFCNNQFELRRDRGLKNLSCNDCKYKLKGHNMADSKPYAIWQQMRQRCTNPESKSYHRYGGRGIVVDEAWSDFDGFWKDMGPTYRDGLSIDRTNNDGNYMPGNCQWITRSENGKKTSRTRPVYQIDKNTGNILKRWESAAEASREVKVHPNKISDTCRGKQNTSAGFIWKYVDETDIPSNERRKCSRLK